MFCQHYDDFLLAAQMGVVVYGYRPKIWFLLNRHDRFDTLLQEIQSTPFDESPGNDIGQFFLIYPASLTESFLKLLSFISAAAQSVLLSEGMIFVCLPLQVKRWHLLDSTSWHPWLEEGRGSLVLLSSSLTKSQMTTSHSPPAISELQVCYLSDYN